MSVKKFKFVSPGVFINEIDNSFIPKSADAIGPVVIGRSARGLAMTPTKIESYSKFVELFGDTVPGNGGGDVYRYGNFQSPMYGTYAAKAFLRANVAPLTYIRLLGQQTNAGSSAGGAAAAGYKTTQNLGTAAASKSSANGGAYGLFVAKSGSSMDLLGETSGALHLAAVFYMNTGSVQLRGTIRQGDDEGTGCTASVGKVVEAAGAVVSMGTDGLFTLCVSGSNKGSRRIKFNFDDSSDKFIRRRVNTNPTLLSTAGAFYPQSAADDIVLGESFEQELRDRGMDSLTNLHGVVLGLALSGTATTGPHAFEGQASTEARTGWIIGQEINGVTRGFEPQAQQKLFRLKGRGHGGWLHKNIKVSITNIRKSNTTLTDYGTFTVLLRDINDTDNNVTVFERFDNCSLDPKSPNYIARVIGDKYVEWDSNERRLKEYGNYDNQSKYVWVDMNDKVDEGGAEPSLLPFGYFGPPKFRNLISASVGHQFANTFIINAQGLSGSGNVAGATPMSGGALTVGGAQGAGVRFALNVAGGKTGCGPADLFVPVQAATASFFFPKDRLRVSASAGGQSDPTDSYFGISTTRTSGSTRADASVLDTHNLLYGGFPDDITANTGTPELNPTSYPGVDAYSYVFSLNDVVLDPNGNYYYQSGSRSNVKLEDADSLTAGIANGSVTSGSIDGLLNAGYGNFTAPFYGGFDGFDIFKPDPLYNAGMSTTSTEDTSYIYHTYRRAIDTVSDPEVVDMNLLTVPGLTNNALTEHAINVCENRGDAMALIDLPSVYVPNHESYNSDKSAALQTTPVRAAEALRTRRIDSSYGATFYPWVQTRDDNTGANVWIPPTVAMLGVLASSQAKTDVWFAPAGFNRGGLTDGAAGIPIIGVTEKLTSKQRDTLYDSNINPIASFPSTGIVVFGQKTLQERQSALDRINVRRLVIYLKKQISIISSQVLFEQNVQSTWNRFKSLVEPFLANVKVQFGITDYRLILDETTTTPDLIDQNILYAKIMVKPARAIEFIAIDFVIASSGASFDD